jgi:hypothetical protein
VISHTEPDGSTKYVRDVVAGRGVPTGPIQSAGGTDRASGEGKLPFLEATGSAESGPTRDSSGRFSRRTQT